MKFNPDSPFFRILTKAADLILLNLLFLLCCIPVVTIGAAVTAMYYVTLKMAKDENTRTTASFFRSFRQNFRQSTYAWLGFLAFFGFVGLDLWLLQRMDGSLLTAVLRMGLLIACLLAFLWSQYLFAFLARFETGLKDALKHSLLLAIAYLPKSILMVLMWGASVAASLSSDLVFTIALAFWPMMGFSVLTLGCACLLRNIFDHVIPEGSTSLDNKTITQQN